MGMFKDAKNAMGGAGDLAAGAQSMAAGAQSQADALQAGLSDGSFDPNDPAFAPIEGVDLDGYAKAVGAVVKANAATEDEAAKVAEGAGIPKGKWKAVSDGWNGRMKTSRAVMNRYGVLYGQYS